MKCKRCGTSISGPAQKRYCEKCVIEKRREYARNRKRKAREQAVSKAPHIKGQTARLSQDVHDSIVAGISYGAFKGRDSYRNLWENRKIKYEV